MDSVIVTGEQIRAARALLRINQKELAAEAKLSLETIKRLESMRGEIDASLKTLKALRSAFFRLGAVFEISEDIDTVVGIRGRPDRVSQAE